MPKILRKTRAFRRYLCSVAGEDGLGVSMSVMRAQAMRVFAYQGQMQLEQTMLPPAALPADEVFWQWTGMLATHL